MQKIIFIMLFVINGLITSAQNNPIFQGGAGDGITKRSFAQAGSNIFTGGSGDGWMKSSFTQANTNIFIGGTGDGWNKANFSQAGNAIFRGGEADGWSKTTFLQPGNSIFNGGDGDGWSKTTFLQAGNAIFNGGEGDGWNSTSFLQPGNNIFNGGRGDGWSSTYIPTGPLPVTFIYFNATKQNEITALLNWKTSQEINSSHFEVERSNDAVNFTYIGRVTASGNSSSAINYFFTDYQPAKGLNYYRLKQVDLDGKFIYTAARLVRFDQIDEGKVKYYPNPTNGILNIELTKEMQAEMKIINISNAAGILVKQFRVAANTEAVVLVNMNKFPKGVYFIQVRTTTVNSTGRIVLL